MNLPARNTDYMGYGKLPPQAIELEEAVLGALIVDDESFENIGGVIDTPGFYKEEHQKIFDVIKELKLKNKQVDLLIVTQELKNRDILNEVGGPAYITGLTGKVSVATNIESHARIIAEKYYQRETIRKASELIRMAYAGEDVELISNEWNSSAESLEDIFTVADTGTHIKQVLKNTIIEIEQDCVRVQEDKTPGVPTGFVGLDINTGGWREGNLALLAARPGVGKTSFALFFAISAAKAGYWVNFFSYEMNKEDLARIILAGESGIYRSNIRDGYIKDHEWERINQTVSELDELPILFRDASGMNSMQLRSAIRKNKKNGKCDFAIIDYLQLVKPVEKKGTRELEVSEISSTLKGTALKYKVPILALSQLNRDADNGSPKLSHLRESGVLEQDADLVMFLVPDESNIRLMTSKHRRGRLGDRTIYPNEEMTKFSDNMPMPAPVDEEKRYNDF